MQFCKTLLSTLSTCACAGPAGGKGRSRPSRWIGHRRVCTSLCLLPHHASPFLAFITTVQLHAKGLCPSQEWRCREHLLWNSHNFRRSFNRLKYGSDTGVLGVAAASGGQRGCSAAGMHILRHYPGRLGGAEHAILAGPLRELRAAAQGGQLLPRLRQGLPCSGVLPHAIDGLGPLRSVSLLQLLERCILEHFSNSRSTRSLMMTLDTIPECWYFACH